MQSATEVTSFEYLDYPIGMAIRIHQQDDGFDADLLALGQFMPLPIEITLSDLEALNRELQAELETISRSNTDRNEISSEQEAADLLALAEIGHDVFKRVFADEQVRNAIQDLMSRNKCKTIQIASENFFIPWEVLYPIAPDSSTLSYENFWGMNYIITRLIIQKPRPKSAFVNPLIAVEVLPNLGLLMDQELTAVREKELPYFEHLAKSGKITLFKLRSLDAAPEKRFEEYDEFMGFWSNTFHVAHFACHASYEDDRPSHSHILLSDDYPVTLRDLSIYPIEIDAYNPLVILNACETGNLNPLYTSNFAREFLKLGARGVVATECAVPDSFAADFARELYGHLLSGDELGTSLLETRRHFLKEYQNPTGLLYAMYAPPSICLVHTNEVSKE